MEPSPRARSQALDRPGPPGRQRPESLAPALEVPSPDNLRARAFESGRTDRDGLAVDLDRLFSKGQSRKAQQGEGRRDADRQRQGDEHRQGQIGKVTFAQPSLPRRAEARAAEKGREQDHGSQREKLAARPGLPDQGADLDPNAAGEVRDGHPGVFFNRQDRNCMIGPGGSGRGGASVAKKKKLRKKAGRKVARKAAKVSRKAAGKTKKTAKKATRKKALRKATPKRGSKKTAAKTAARKGAASGAALAAAIGAPIVASALAEEFDAEEFGPEVDVLAADDDEEDEELEAELPEVDVLEEHLDLEKPGDDDDGEW